MIYENALVVVVSALRADFEPQARRYSKFGHSRIYGLLEYLCRFRYTVTCFQQRRENSEDHAVSSNCNRDS